MNQANAKDLHSLSSANRLDWIDGTRIGRIVSIDAEDRVIIDYPGNPHGPMPAMLCASVLEKIQTGAEDSRPRLVLLFEENDPSKPIVVDIIVEKISPLKKKELVSIDINSEQNCTVEGKNIQFNADNQIVLKCGKASITLTRSGKVLIRGAYLVNRSTGVNRIRGASVHVN